MAPVMELEHFIWGQKIKIAELKAIKIKICISNSFIIVITLTVN